MPCIWSDNLLYKRYFWNPQKIIPENNTMPLILNMILIIFMLDLIIPGYNKFKPVLFNARAYPTLQWTENI